MKLRQGRFVRRPQPRCFSFAACNIGDRRAGQSLVEVHLGLDLVAFGYTELILQVVGKWYSVEAFDFLRHVRRDVTLKARVHRL